MASKNLKAVAVRGTRAWATSRTRSAFMQTTAEQKQVLAENAVTGQGLPTFGTQVLMNVINEIGAMPTRNMREVQFEERTRSRPRRWPSRASDGRANLTPTRAASVARSPAGASPRWTRATSRSRTSPVLGQLGWLEYEAAWALGCDTGVGDLDALTYANFLCNEDGWTPSPSVPRWPRPWSSTKTARSTRRHGG